MHLSFFLILVELAGQNLDELSFGDYELRLFAIFVLVVSVFQRFIVGATNQLHNLLISEVLFEVVYHLFETLLCDDLGVGGLINKQLVGLLNVLFAVFLRHLYNHDFQKLLEIDASLIILSVFLAIAEITNELAYLLVGWVEAKGSKDHFKIFGFDGSRTRHIKEVEGLLNFVLLRVGEHLLVVQDLLVVHSRA